MDLDASSTTKILKSSSKKNKIEHFTKYINFGLIVLVIALIGYYIYKNLPSTSSSISSSNKIEPTTAIIAESKASKIMIDISGAVKQPGVYEFEEGSRVIDVLEKSGGFTEKVDLDYVEKNINKAQRLADSQKIYIPSIGENTANIPPQLTSAPTNANPSSAASKTNGKVSINSGTRQQLIDLPEIGEVTADKIINARPYSTIDQLVSKGALKQSSLDKIRNMISL